MSEIINRYILFFTNSTNQKCCIALGIVAVILEILGLVKRNSALAGVFLCSMAFFIIILPFMQGSVVSNTLTIIVSAVVIFSFCLAITTKSLPKRSSKHSSKSSSRS